MEIFMYVLLSVLLVSLVSFVGVFTLSLSNRLLKKSLLFLVSFAAGALLGDVFIHLLPELAEEYGFGLSAGIYVILGILIFFILERYLHWQHCHDGECKQHKGSIATMNLVGDGLHNFIDGILIAGSYLVDIQLGIATTIAVLLHEIPQEIGDFSILIHSGYSKKRALFFNFLSALTAVVGGSLAFVFKGLIENTNIIVPFTAGAFLYIASSDLIPELHKEHKFSVSLLHLLGMILGVAIMASLLLLE